MSTFKHSEETKQYLRKPKKTKDKYAESKIGEKNPMYGISLNQLWTQKYGIEEAIIKEQNRIEKISSKQIGQKRTKEICKNISEVLNIRKNINANIVEKKLLGVILNDGMMKTANIKM